MTLNIEMLQCRLGVPKSRALGCVLLAVFFSTCCPPASERRRCRSLTTANFAVPLSTPSGLQGSLRATAAHRARLNAQREPAVQRPAVALAEDSSTWLLPSVDKDVDGFYKGRANGYAWVQTTETLYIFAPMPPRGSGDDEGPPNVEFAVTNEGWDVHLAVEGKTILQGRMAHAVKPGTEIWMIEESRDGSSFAVAEVDKLLPGIEWTSVMEPHVSFSSDYSRPKVQLRSVTPEEQAAAVEATLGHLQRKRGHLREAAADHAAVFGDVLKVDIKGFERTPEGTRGAPLEVASAEDMQFELGSQDSGLLPQMHEQLVGVTPGEARDVELTLGQRGGGRQVICEITCKELKEQVLPEFNDEFAQAVKRDEQFLQAGTEAGIPEEEEDMADVFTMDALRAEITEEVRMQAEVEAQTSVKSQLEAALLDSAKVDCEWGELNTHGKDETALLKEEEFAAIIHSVAEREGLLRLIDDDKVERQTWHALGTPKEGETIAEVGDDPAREFQEAKRKVQRRHELEQVTQWLQERMEVTELAE